MKRYTIHTFSALALLLAATACTRDDEGTLSDSTQPLTLTAAIEGSADTRATVDNRWNGNETIALQVTDGDGTDWYDYMVDDKGNLSGDYYWTNPSSITVQGLYPNIMAESNDWTWGVPSPCRAFTRILWRKATTGLGAWRKTKAAMRTISQATCSAVNPRP